jgi:hypothetical protein
METGISRRGRATSLAFALTAALAAAGCGGASMSTRSAPVATTAALVAPARAASPGAFAWLRPAAAPAGWRSVPIANGAAMPYPAGWRHVHGDAGTATAILGGGADGDSGARVSGYLNLTPLQGDETLANWARYRVKHNAGEGDRAIRTLASGAGLRFRTGLGSCVRDSYTTGSGARYVEIACLVKGARATSVIVGATPPDAWARVSPQLQRAISSLST